MASVVQVKVWSKYREKEILEKTELYFKGYCTFFKEKLDFSIQNDLLFKEKHLVVTKEFFICYDIAIPIKQIEKFYFLQVTPEVSDVLSVFRTGEACTCRLVCELVSGKSIERSMGDLHRKYSISKIFLNIIVE